MLDLQLIYKALYGCRKCATIRSTICHHCLVIHVLTNVGMFGIKRKYILSSLDQQLSDNVIVKCAFTTDK